MPPFTTFVNSIIDLLKKPGDQKASERFLEATLAGGALAQKIAQMLLQNGAVDAETRRALGRRICTSLGHHEYTWTQQQIAEFLSEFPQFAEALQDEELQEVPIASGSCAQIHLAGNYAVKVVHPSVAREVESWYKCLPALRLAMRLAGFAFLAQTLELTIRSIQAQLDMARECADMRETYEARWFQDLAPGIRTPRPIAATKNVLLMELQLFPTVAELIAEGQEDIDCAAALACLVYMQSACESRAVMNTDLHAGNLGVRGQLDFVIYDYGSTTRLEDAAPIVLGCMENHELISTCCMLYGEEARPFIEETYAAACKGAIEANGQVTTQSDLTLKVMRALLASNHHIQGDRALDAYRCITNFLLNMRALSRLEPGVAAWAQRLGTSDPLDARLLACQSVHCNVLILTAFGRLVDRNVAALRASPYAAVETVCACATEYRDASHSPTSPVGRALMARYVDVAIEAKQAHPGRP